MRPLREIGWDFKEIIGRKRKGLQRLGVEAPDREWGEISYEPNATNQNLARDVPWDVPLVLAGAEYCRGVFFVAFKRPAKTTSLA